MTRVRDRETLIARLVDHHRSPRHRGRMPDADVSAPGGNPDCGDVVTVYLRASPDGQRVAEASFEGTGCTISQGAASILLARVNRDHPTFDAVREISYEEVLDDLGPEVVGFRHRCATLALGTLKAAVRTLELDRKLRAAGHSEEDIRRLRAAAGRVAGGDGSG